MKRTSKNSWGIAARAAVVAGLLLPPATGALAQLAPVQAPRFEIQRFVVDGNTILANDEVDRLLRPFTGPGRDFGDVQRALEVLQDTYLARGFSAVRVIVPEQDLDRGQVRLRVIEARIRQVRVEDNRYFDSENVRASVPMVREGSVPNTREIGRGVQLANENPARQIGVALESTDDDSGRIDAVLRVADENPRRATLFADNTGSSQTGFLRAGAGFQHANVGGRDHVLNLQYVTAPANPSKVTILGAGYHVPLYALKASLDFIAGYSDVDSGTVAGLFTVSGSGQVYAVRYNQTLPRYEGYDHKLVLGWDYRAFRQNVSLVGTTGTLVPDITVQPLSLSYSGRLSQAGSDLGGSVSIARNLPGGTDGGQNAFTAQRAGAKAAYTVLRYGLSYSRAIGQEMILRASFSGQYSNDLLVSGEQFGMGGADSVRGFFEREAANDRGQRASVELYGPDLGKTTFGGDWKARLLAFADSAWGRDNVPERGGKNGLSSVGIGLRMSEGKRWSIRADVALATNGVATRPDSSGRVHLGVAYGF